MDITQNELKVMKAKQLRRIIREAIEEVLNEGKADDLRLQADKLRQQALNLMKQATAEDEKDLKLQQQATKAAVAEGELDEAKKFKLADPNFDTSQYADKRISGVSLADIIDFIRDKPEGIDKKSLQVQFNFARPQIANAIVNALKDAGVLVKLGAGGDIEAEPEPGEEAPTKATEPEDLFMGGADNPLSMYFDDEPNNDGSEDFTDETEPEAGELEKAEKPASSMSDEDYEAFMKYDELKRRLDATKSNILKTRKSRGTAGDISDKPSTELQRLRDLKKSLEDRINDLVAGSDYLKKKLAKENPPAPTVELPDEEETLEEGLDEYDLRKLQYYAGIRK